MVVSKDIGSAYVPTLIQAFLLRYNRLVNSTDFEFTRLQICLTGHRFGAMT